MRNQVSCGFVNAGIAPPPTLQAGILVKDDDADAADLGGCAASGKLPSPASHQRETWAKTGVSERCPALRRPG
jgi:hypothetical protein